MSGDFDLIFTFIGLFVFEIFIFKRELLIYQESFRVILGICILLFLTGLVLHFTRIGRESAYDALFTPIMSLLSFRLLRKLFIARLGREPKDTFFDWSSELDWDRLFNIVYCVLNFGLFIFALAITDLLVKAGW